MAPTLLIVDDHATFRAFARRLLESAGFAVIGEAGDGESAIRAVHDLRPDVVLLDVVLPDVDGFTVCAAVTGGDHYPAVVLTSSRDATTYRRRLRHSRARGFIPKSELTGTAVSALVE